MLDSAGVHNNPLVALVPRWIGIGAQELPRLVTSAPMLAELGPDQRN